MSGVRMPGASLNTQIEPTRRPGSARDDMRNGGYKNNTAQT